LDSVDNKRWVLNRDDVTNSLSNVQIWIRDENDNLLSGMGWSIVSEREIIFTPGIAFKVK
jgi:hypothetical protein